MASEQWPLESEHFVYRAALVRVVDGDTYDMRVDLGFRIFHRIRVRLAGVDTAETYGVKHSSEEYQTGMLHSRWVRGWFDGQANGEEFPFLVSTKKGTGKYGRWAALIRARSNGDSLRSRLVAAFPAVDEWA